MPVTLEHNMISQLDQFDFESNPVVYDPNCLYLLIDPSTHLVIEATDSHAIAVEIAEQYGYVIQH